MIRIRFRLRTIMIVVAFAALVLTVVIQGVLLRRAAIAQPKRAPAVQQNAADQRVAEVLKKMEGFTQAQMESSQQIRKSIAAFADEMAIESERTRGGFNRSIRPLDPPSDETEPKSDERE